MKKRPLLLTLILAAALAACAKAPALPESPAPSEIQPGATPQAPVEFVPILAVNTGDPSKGMVYLEDTASGQRSPYLELSDLYSDHYHPLEYHNGSLFVMHRFEYSGPGDDDWRSELWVYDAAKKGKLVFASRSLDFRAAPDEMTLAVSDNDRLYFMDTNGNAFAQLSAAQLGEGLAGSEFASIELESWAEDGSRFWGNLSAASQVLGFFEANASGSEMKAYDLAAVPFSRQEYALNPDTGKVVFSDYPRFFDADSAEKFKASGSTVTLYLLDLPGMQLTVIATNTAKEFHPQWLDEARIQYDDPKAPDQQLVYALK